MIDPDTDAIEARLAAASGASWGIAATADGQAVVRVDFPNGGTHAKRVTRDDLPASIDDIRFHRERPP